MKRLIALLALTLLCVAPLTFTGCGTPPQRVAYNTLATLGTGTSQAYQAYLQQVIQGNVATNDVPKVTAQYRQFIALYNAACVAASVSTNFAAVTPELQNAANAVTSAITTAKTNK